MTTYLIFSEFKLELKINCKMNKVPTLRSDVNLRFMDILIYVC